GSRAVGASGRVSDLPRPLLAHTAVALAGEAGAGAVGADAVTGVSGLVRDHLAQQGAGHALDAAGAVAQAAGLDRGPFLRAGTRAGVAHDRGGHVEVDGAAEGRGLQDDADADDGVMTALVAFDRAASLTSSYTEGGNEHA